MCGILLEYNKAGQFAPNFRERLDTMVHRGNDQDSVCEYPTCKVGFRRLAITDRHTEQPGRCEQYHNPSKLSGITSNAPHQWHVYINGQAYNYKSLGFQGSECDVLAQGFARYGCDFVKRLDGMFVIVAVCGADVYVFRDRYGQKPLYYFQSGKTIALASEIKPLLAHPDYRFAVNESARQQWLTFNNVFTDETLFEGIHKMERGTYWHLNTGKKVKYWEWNFTPQQIDYREAVREVRRLVEKAVQEMTPKEVAFGSLLSGGVDSGIIAALLPDCPVFTAGYNGGDERQLAELSGKSKHYQIVFNKVTDLQSAIYHLEDLRVGASWSNYGLFGLASKFCKVVFEGTGADELFSGYGWRYTEHDYWNIVNRTGVDNEHCRKVFAEAFPVDTLKARFKFDAEHFLEAVLLVGDRMSMAHTVETRQPFLSNDLVDFALTLPHEYRQGKRILKDAFADVLPPEILNAKKRGWTSPDWFSGDGNAAKKWSETALQTWQELFNFAG